MTAQDSAGIGGSAVLAWLLPGGGARLASPIQRERIAAMLSACSIIALQVREVPGR
jgi:hypothetical protein